MNDETSQNSSEVVGSLNNLSQFVELNKEERTALPSSNPNQSIIDNRFASKFIRDRKEASLHII